MPFPLKMSFPYSVVLIVIPRARNSGGSGWIPVISPHELITEHLTLPAEPSCSRGTHTLCISHRGRASKPAPPSLPSTSPGTVPILAGGTTCAWTPAADKSCCRLQCDCRRAKHHERFCLHPLCKMST